MLIVSYDFSNDKVRSEFAKFLKQYGYKLQYSVFQIRNSQRILKMILNEIELRYKKKIKSTDSVLVFQVCSGCKKKIIKYGMDENLDNSVVFF